MTEHAAQSEKTNEEATTEESNTQEETGDQTTPNREEQASGDETAEAPEE